MSYIVTGARKDFFVEKESLFNFAPIKKIASKYAILVRMAYLEAYFQQLIWRKVKRILTNCKFYMQAAYNLLLLCILNSARKKRSMSKKNYDTSKEFSFNELQSSSNERLKKTVTIYRGVHPQSVKNIPLKDLLCERLSDDMIHISTTLTMANSYEKYLLDGKKELKKEISLRRKKKSQTVAHLTIRFST
jgi:uncharacterized transporter YbjL